MSIYNNPGLFIFAGTMILTALLFWRAISGRQRFWHGDLLPAPGTALWQSTDRSGRWMDALTGVLILIFAVVALLTPATADTLLTIRVVLIGLALVLLIIYGLLLNKWFKSQQRLQAVRLTGQELNALSSEMIRVFHDVPLLKKAVRADHLLVGPGGVFVVMAVAPPTVTTPVRDRVARFNGEAIMFGDNERRDILKTVVIRSEAVASWLRSEFGKSDSIPVVPVVAVPGWTMEIKGEHTVRVINPRNGNAIRPWLEQQKLDTKRVREIAWAIEKRCREATPWGPTV